MMDRRGRLAESRLYLVTGPQPASFLDEVLSAGVDVVQLRDKTGEAADILRAASIFRDACDRHGALFVINDRADLALAAGADGLHIGQTDLPPNLARRLVGDEMLIGLSTHTPEQMHRAVEAPVDYFCVGPVFETPTKPGREATGYDLVRLAAKEAPEKPWFAIGGIDESNGADVAEAGASRIVVVRAVTQAPDPAAAAARLRSHLSRLLAKGVVAGYHRGRRGSVCDG